MRACFWRFESEFDTSPRAVDMDAPLPQLVRSVLGLPFDGKTYCRVQNSAGEIVELVRTSATALKVTPLRPSGPPHDLEDSALESVLAKFCG